MFAELEKVMHYSIDSDDFADALGRNVTGKKSTSGVRQTGNFLKRLYGFDLNDPQFVSFKYFWKVCESYERPILALVFAVHRDELLAESIDVVSNVALGERISVELFEHNVEKHHPNQYFPITARALAVRIASSWKQAGFVKGKVKGIRTHPEIGFRIACFAFLLAYLNGAKGDYIWNSVGVKSLCLPESKLRELAIECAKRDMMQYQYAGGVTAISFKKLLTTIGLHAI
jgi:hypothetical protein